ncbi:MAG: glycine cleavage system protein GcvH [Thermoprotei archaeon]|nr:MAG: glycine cleavage system protein GcvH [Thermoprotei archaeon]
MDEVKYKDYVFPRNLKYSKEHGWVKEEGEKVRIGITDYAQGQLKEIVYVELPEKGDEIIKGESYGVIESIKALEDLIAPISGRILEVNEAVVDNPTIISEDPYGKGWVLVVEPSERSELETLLTAEEYVEQLKKE